MVTDKIILKRKEMQMINEIVFQRVLWVYFDKINNVKSHLSKPVFFDSTTLAKPVLPSVF